MDLSIEKIPVIVEPLDRIMCLTIVLDNLADWPIFNINYDTILSPSRTPHLLFNEGRA